MIASEVKELWAIEHDSGLIVPPLDDDGTDVIMCWSSKEEAEIGLRGQQDRGYVDGGRVVKLFPKDSP